MSNNAHFSLPARFRSGFLEKLVDFNESAEIPALEVYGSLNPSAYGSGRKPSLLPEIRINDLERYVNRVSELGLEFNYVLNFNVITPESLCKLSEFVRDLVKIGIARFTVASYEALDVLRSISNVKITISTIANVDSLSSLNQVKKFSTVDRICFPEKLNRNLPLLTSLTQDASLSYSVIINSLCLLECPYREQHYAYESQGALAVENKLKYSRLCENLIEENPSEYIKAPWIYPKDIDRYITAGISCFKIAGREMKDESFIEVMKYYNRRFYDGNLIDLMTCFSEMQLRKCVFINAEEISLLTPIILRRPTGCSRRQCSACKLCAEWADQYIELNLSEIEERKNSLNDV